MQKECKYSKSPFLQPRLMYVSDDHQWPLRLLVERNFSLGSSQWMSQTDAPWTHWSILMRRERETYTHTHRTNWLLCCYMFHGERHTDTQRENQLDVMCHLLELTPPRKSVHVSRQIIRRGYRAQRSPLSHSWKAIHQLGSWETLPDKWSRLFNK